MPGIDRVAFVRARDSAKEHATVAPAAMRVPLGTACSHAGALIELMVQVALQTCSERLASFNGFESERVMHDRPLRGSVSSGDW